MRDFIAPLLIMMLLVGISEFIVDGILYPFTGYVLADLPLVVYLLLGWNLFLVILVCYCTYNDKFARKFVLASFGASDKKLLYMAFFLTFLMSLATILVSVSQRVGLNYKFFMLMEIALLLTTLIFPFFVVRKKAKSVRENNPVG